jgi:hypothetical protein
LCFLISWPQTQSSATSLAYLSQIPNFRHRGEGKESAHTCPRVYFSGLGKVTSMQHLLSSVLQCDRSNTRNEPSRSSDNGVEVRPLLDSESTVDDTHARNENIQTVRAQGTGYGRVGIPSAASARTVYIGNLPWSIPPADIIRELVAAASKYGDVEAVRV